MKTLLSDERNLLGVDISARRAIALIRTSAVDRDRGVQSCAAVAESEQTPAPLSSYAHDEFSQNGEDGILGKVFEALDVDSGRCVEFGAWDGVHLSNTHNLIRNHGWRGVLIEADSTKFHDLQQTAEHFNGVTCLNRLVGFDPPDNLDSILAATDMPSDFDLLSIDIDGNDYHVWASMNTYRPKIVVIEINPTMPNHVDFVQVRDMDVKHGSSLLALTQLAEEKGYQLVAAPGCNGIFARDDVFPVLDVRDNSLDTLRPGHEDETSILHLFDGTLALAGRTRHPWNGIELREEYVQILPSRLRTYTPEASPRMLRLQAAWARLYGRVGRRRPKSE